MVADGKISNPKKSSKPKQIQVDGNVTEAAPVKPKAENEYFTSKSGKPVKKAAKGLTFEDLQGPQDY